MCESVGVYSLKYTRGYGILSFGSVKEPKRANRCVLWLHRAKKTFYSFAIDSYLNDSAFKAVKGDKEF